MVGSLSAAYRQRPALAVEGHTVYLANRVQITADGFKPYLVAVDDAFGSQVDVAQLIKIYGETSEGQKR
jgi:hypothetical protein